VAALRGIPGIGFMFFDEADIVRHELVTQIVKAYRRHREPLGSEGPARRTCGAKGGKTGQDSPTDNAGIAS